LDNILTKISYLYNNIDESSNELYFLHYAYLVTKPLISSSAFFALAFKYYVFFQYQTFFLNSLRNFDVFKNIAVDVYYFMAFGAPEMIMGIEIAFKPLGVTGCSDHMDNPFFREREQRTIHGSQGYIRISGPDLRVDLGRGGMFAGYH
jgi:hypothetical protein